MCQRYGFRSNILYFRIELRFVTVGYVDMYSLQGENFYQEHILFWQHQCQAVTEIGLFVV